MKILITGGAGFIGSHICDAYVHLGHEVAVVDNLSSGKKRHIHPNARFYKVDMRDAKKLLEVFNREKPEIVSHHAARTGMKKSEFSPVFDARVNIIGSLNLLECARKNNVKKIIYASSGGTLYGECGKVPPREKSAVRPVSPSGIAKYTVEKYLMHYRRMYGMSYTIFRYSNVYGPRQDPRRDAGVVAIFSHRMLKWADVYVYGSGNQERDYVYVKDLVHANVLALNSGADEVLNIATSTTTSVKRLVQLLSDISGYNREPQLKSRRPGEVLRSCLSADKAKKLMGWQAQTNLEEGLKETIAYYRMQPGI